MKTLFVVVLAISTGVWTGSIVFQSAIVAPAVFAALDTTAARSFLRLLFPRFFRFGLICGALMLASILGFGFVAGWTKTVIVLACVTGIMIVLQAASLLMVPSINSARDAGKPGQAKFARLHRSSVLLTISILLLGIIVLAVLATRAAAVV